MLGDGMTPDQRRDLDRHITGNWGEDSVPFEDDDDYYEDDYDPCCDCDGYSEDCEDCEWS